MKLSKNKQFVFGNGRRGFGYVIRDIRNKDKRRTIFHSSSKEQTLEIFETIEENFNNLPEPIQNWKPQLLIIETKHYMGHYIVKSVEDLDVVAFNIIKDSHNNGSKYSPFQKWELPEKYNEMIPVDYIMSCPDKEVKEKMLEKNRQNQSQIDEYSRHNNLVDTIENMIEKNDTKNAYNLLSEMDFFIYEFELKKFDN